MKINLDKYYTSVKLANYCWIQRETFFNESGLIRFLDDAKI